MGSSFTPSATNRRTFLTAAIGVSFAGCLGDNDDNVFESNVGTTADGGAAQIIGASLAEIANESAEVELNAITTGGAIDNMFLLEDGDVHLALLNSGNLYMGTNAMGPFENEITMMTLMRLFTSPHWFVARADSDVDELADLEGEAVGVGERGSAANYETELIFETLGIDIEPRYLSWSEAANALSNDSIAASYTYAILPAFQQLSERMDLKAVSFGDRLDELLEFPTFSEAAVPMDVENADIRVISQEFYVGARPDVPEQAAYVITEEIVTNEDRARESHVLMEGFDPEAAPDDVNGSVSIHPGAKQYYEDAGLL